MHPQNDLTQQKQQKQQNPKNQKQQNNKSALGFMLISVVLFSTFPFVLAISNASAAPFLFTSLINFSVAINGLIFLVWFHRTKRKTQTAKETLHIIYSKIHSKAFFWLALSRSDAIFFAMSLAYINIAVASILTAVQPFIIAMLIARFFKKHGRYHKITAKQWLLFVLALVGSGFVVASQSETFGAIIGDLLNQDAIIGLLLVLLSVFVGGMQTPYSLKFGNDISAETKGGTTDELFFTMAFMVGACLVASALFFTTGKLSNESFNNINIIPPALYGFLSVIAVILYRFANIKTTNLGINALAYVTPLVSLVWLGLASLINIPHFDWLVIGASAIIIANILLNLKADTRHAYTALAITLWLSSAIIYLFYDY